MADKKAILIFADKAMIKEGDNIAAVLKKAVVLPYSGGGSARNGACAVEGAVTAGAEQAGSELAAGTPLTIVDLKAADDAGLDAALSAIIPALDRHTILAIAGSGSLALHGLGISKTMEEKVQTTADDVLPTIAAVSSIHLPKGFKFGRVIYEALRDINGKQKEVDKLQESLRSMQAAMERDSREPWDKHDCA